MEAWASAARGWLAAEHGERLVASVLHLDEVTPHIQGLLVPVDGRGVLNAKALFNRSTLRAAQTSYAAALRGLRARLWAELRPPPPTPNLHQLRGRYPGQNRACSARLRRRGPHGRRTGRAVSAGAFAALEERMGRFG